MASSGLLRRVARENLKSYKMALVLVVLVIPVAAHCSWRIEQSK
jgi:hypothetical protein